MLAWIAYLFIAIVWGTTFTAIAVAVRTFTPLGLVGARFVLAALLALGLGRLRKEAAPPRGEWSAILGSGLLMIFGTYTLMFWAETQISSGLAAVLVATQPILFVLMARERLAPLGWAGLGLGFFGVAFIAGFSSGGAFSWGGAAATVLGEVLWVAGTLLGRARYRTPASFTRTGWQMLAGGLPALLLTAPTGRLLIGPLNAAAIGSLLFLVVAGSVLAFTAYLYLVEVWQPSKVGTYAYLNAPVAVAVGAWLLHEPFTLRMGLGCALVLAGVALVEYTPRRTAAPELPLGGEA